MSKPPKWAYRCGACNGMVNPGGPVYLIGERDGDRYLVGFHPEPGNYEVIAPVEVTFVEGELWTFLCPICHANLQSAEHQNLCELLMEGAKPHRLFFSRVAGEHATYVVVDERSEKHGKEAANYDITTRIKHQKRTD